LWIVDEEPLHVDTDSWARNSIPIRSLEKHYKKIPQEIEVAEVIEEEKKKVVKKRLSIMKQPEVPIVKVKKRASASIAPAAVRVQRNEPTYDPNRMISEENQRTLTRAQTTDKDQPTQDYTFDPDGRLIPLVQPHWTVPVNVKAKVQAVEKPKMEPKAPNTAREKKAAKQKTPRMSVLKSPVDGFIEDPTLNVPTMVIFVHVDGYHQTCPWSNS
jgi:hypothetical protein